VSVAPATDIGLLIETAPMKNLRAVLKTYVASANPTKASPISQVKKEICTSPLIS